jgi:hypothetical protein
MIYLFRLIEMNEKKAIIKIVVFLFGLLILYLRT